MKILIIYQYFGTPEGSWSTRIYEFAKRWVNEGCEVTVITSPYEKSDIRGKNLIDKQTIEGIKLIVINSADSNRDQIITRTFKAIFFAIISSYFVLRLDYRLVLASSGPITVGIPMILSKKIRKKRTVFEVRDLWPAGGIEMKKIKMAWQKNMSLWFESKCYKNADLIVTASVGQMSHIQNRYPQYNIRTISQASDLDLFGKNDTEWELPEWARGQRIFTHIGSLGFIHNVGFILDSAYYIKKHHRESCILIVLVGDGAERKELESKAKELSLDNVRFIGLLPKTEVVNWVHASVATLFTTLDNPVQNTSSPNKIFDSFAAGKPIIQTTTGWIKDLVEETECGINIKPGDNKTFAEAMCLLASSNEKVDILGRNAMKLAKGRFNRDLLAKEYLDAIQSIG